MLRRTGIALLQSDHLVLRSLPSTSLWPLQPARPNHHAPPSLRTTGARKVAPSAAPPAGILKTGWLRKHRTSRPAVAALLVDRASGAAQVEGALWAAPVLWLPRRLAGMPCQGGDGSGFGFQPNPWLSCCNPSR